VENYRRRAGGLTNHLQAGLSPGLSYFKEAAMLIFSISLEVRSRKMLTEKEAGVVLKSDAFGELYAALNAAVNNYNQNQSACVTDVSSVFVRKPVVQL